jgi:hypothetical protein
VQRALLLASNPAQKLLHSMQVVGDPSRLAHLPGAPTFSHGSSGRFFVDIEPDVDFNFVHMVSLLVRLFHSGDPE